MRDEALTISAIALLAGKPLQSMTQQCVAVPDRLFEYLSFAIYLGHLTTRFADRGCLTALSGRAGRQRHLAHLFPALDRMTRPHGAPQVTRHKSAKINHLGALWVKLNH